MLSSFFFNLLIINTSVNTINNTFITSSNLTEYYLLSIIIALVLETNFKIL